MSYSFARYQALGNDMIVLDPATFPLPPTPALIRRLCHRHFGLGADGICYGPLPPERATRRWTMRFFNPDGSEAERSGNGLCIFARYLWDRGLTRDQALTVWIQDEAVRLEVEASDRRQVRAVLGQLTFDSARIPVEGGRRQVIEESVTVAEQPLTITAAALGNPHCIVFQDDVSEAAARTVGPLLEQASLFPNGTNVQLVRVLGSQAIQIAIWERGAGYTLASGTSASAAAGAAVRSGRCRSPVTVHMAGGSAQIAIAADWTVTLANTVNAICRGELAADLVTSLSRL